MALKLISAMLTVVLTMLIWCIFDAHVYNSSGLYDIHANAT